MKSLSAADLSQPKLPPQNLEAEQSVLGAVLLDNSAMAKAMELLVEENFYRTSHRKIYRAMLELSDVGEVIDQITLTERLKAQGEIEAVGGAAYLAELVQERRQLCQYSLSLQDRARQSVAPGADPYLDGSAHARI